MPALYTHYSFGQDVLSNLNKNIQKEINENINYYNMFNQGFDNLFYHHRKWKYYRTFGIKAHTTKIDLFFKTTINYILEHDLNNDSNITNMVYGFINHYTLDTLMHPFINYQVTNLNIPHTKIEFILDGYFYKKNNKQKWRNNIYNTLIPRLKFNKALSLLIEYVFYDIHNEKNIGHIFERSHNNGYYIYRYFINDNLGIKTFIYKIIDFFIPKKDIEFSKNTFKLKEFNEEILNKQKRKWLHPKNKEEKYNYSLEEIYNISLKICIKLNTLAYKVLHEKEDVNKLIDKIKLISLENISLLL